MNTPVRTPLLSLALRVFGSIFMFGIFILNRLWPAGWAWQPEQPAYLSMILGISCWESFSGGQRVIRHATSA
jgi:hypothetical protein